MEGLSEFGHRFRAFRFNASIPERSCYFTSICADDQSIYVGDAEGHAFVYGAVREIGDDHPLSRGKVSRFAADFSILISRI